LGTKGNGSHEGMSYFVVNGSAWALRDGAILASPSSLAASELAILGD
jgi:hypothetical protein